MRRIVMFLMVLLVGVFCAGSVMAQDFIIYPAKGQSQEQMEKDKYECYSWAKQQSGFDPMETPRTTTPPPGESGASVAGGAVKGGAGGALLGLGIGAIAGNAGKGAAIGAVAGGTLGAARSSAQKQEDARAKQQWEKEQVAQYNQKRSSYNRAYSACLEGRGYTVK